MTALVRTVAVAAAALALHAAPARACDRPEPAAVRVVVPPPAPRIAIERNELARESRRLERARERFYATWTGNPWERRRFERWYAERRERLEREWERLDAWARNDRHGHDRWN